MKKTHKVVMLPADSITEANAPIGLFIDTNKLVLRTDKDIPRGNGQHLYIISDDEIKEGDWVYDSSSLPQDAPIKRIRIIDDTHYTLYGDTSRNLKCHYKKIVATTDSLHVFRYDYLPQLPASFIQAYIKAYNEGNLITEVDLEIELHKWVNSTYPVGHRPTYQIKTRPDNTVIVHQSKMYSQQEYNKLLEQIGQMQLEMYTKEQVIKLLNNYRHFAQTGNLSIEMMEKWIQENL